MENKHTPGPWYRYDTHRKVKGDGIVICTDQLPVRVFGNNSEHSAPFIVCQPGMYSSVDLNSAELVANCRLIASAPDLLEILTELYKSDQTMVFIPRHIQAKMKAAIAKAKGGEIEDKRTY